MTPVYTRNGDPPELQALFRKQDTRKAIERRNHGPTVRLGRDRNCYD